MTAPGESGDLEHWDIEMTSLSTLRRRGIDGQVLDIGDTVRVAGNPAKDGSNQMYVRNLMIASGDETREVGLRDVRSLEFAAATSGDANGG